MVHIATCDQWHVLVALEAVRAGKDIYLEKPMGLSLAEDQALREACHRYGAIFQFGTQQRSERNFRFACELVRNGRIGKLHTINVWSPGSNSGGLRRPAPAPDWVDYDMWLGPAPYHRTRRTVPPINGGGSSPTMPWASSRAGCAPARYRSLGGGEKLTGPLEIEGKGVWPDPEGVCDTAMNWDVTCRYDSGVTMHYTGTPYPDGWKTALRTDQ